MRWNPINSGDEVIDARGSGGGMSGMGGGGIPGILFFLLFNKRTRPIALVILLVIIGTQVFGGGGGFSGISPGFGQQVGVPGGAAPKGIPAGQDPEKDLKDFTSYVFVTAQRGWQAAFEQEGRPYEKAKMVLYRNGVTTGGCGSASSAVGPFYCPGDKRVYIDLSFYEDMQQKLGANGDLAWAYVIAHELGHHVQQQLGTEAKVRQMQRENSDDKNELSVRMELQADCYSGVWAHRVFKQGDLEEGDLQEALGAAEAVGDDRLSGGRASPDSFTHGTSAQRQKWFTVGYESGQPGDCDTFSVDEV